MKNYLIRFVKWATGFAAVTVMVIACQKNTSVNPTGGLSTTVPASLKVFLTDDQNLNFDKVFIDIKKIDIKLEDNGNDSLGGWFSLSITPGIYDILQLRNGIDTLFGTGTIPANRKLQKIRLILGNNNSVVINGQTKPLSVKDKNNEVIAQLDETNVELSAPDQFLFWIDFDAGKSIKTDKSGSGNNNGYELRSNIRIFSKKKSGRIEGRVGPADAKAIVLAINGTDTVSAKPEREGEYKFVGLKAGVYSLYFDATANNYVDSTINNIIVRTNEDTKVNTVVLHK